MTTKPSAISIVSLVLSVLALGLSAYSVWLSRAATQEAVYRRILHECWEETRPVREDFGLKDEPPRSFSELLEPLVGVNHNLRKDEPGTE
jgi:hypothetical protein